MSHDDEHSERTPWGRVVSAGVVAILCAALFFFWNPLRATMQAAAIFFELDHNKIPLVLAPVAHHPADVNNTTVPVPGAVPLRALLYAPTDVDHPPAILLIHGVHRLGYDEPRLVAFASALARCGFVVLTPEFPELRDYNITPATVPQIRASILSLSQKQGGPVSVIGLSFAGGLALMASADPDVAPHVKEVMSVGGHASFARVADYYLTGHATGADGKQFSQPPHEYGPLVLVYDHLSDYVQAEDVPAIRDVLRAHLYENSVGEDALAKKLNARQQAEWKQIRESGSAEEMAIARASTAKHTSQMDAVSPEGKLGALQVPVYLLHGAGDSVIPPTELSWLKQDLPASTVKRALVSPMISHVSFGQGNPSIADYWRGLRFLAAFLRGAEK